MTDWQTTATTIYCEAVDDEVTFIVKRDWAARCVSYNRYGVPDKDTGRLLKAKETTTGRKLACEGPECHRLRVYLGKLQKEESGKAPATETTATPEETDA